MNSAYVIRTQSGDRPADSEAQILDWLNQGLCRSGDFVFVRDSMRWLPVCELPVIAPLFASRPDLKVEKLVIYVFVPATRPYQIGPFAVSEMRHKIASGEVGPLAWIFIEGDKEWRQVRQIKILKEVIPLPPQDTPALVAPKELSAESILQVPSAESSVDLLLQEKVPAVPMSLGGGMELEDSSSLPEKKLGPATNPMPNVSMARPKEKSLSFDINTLSGQDATPALMSSSGYSDTGSIKLGDLDVSTSDRSNQVDTGVAVEETTKAFSALGLSLHELQGGSLTQGVATPPPASPPARSAANLPPMPGIPAAVAPSLAPPAAPPAMTPPSAPRMSPPVAPSVESADAFDGITAEIPTDPIWVVKAGTSENIMGPFRFLEVIKFLEEGKLNKNDKISRVGTNRFCKILQQYEFNVKYTLENVVEGGVEKQKIFIRRRHPRVPYMADVQIQHHGQAVQATCINISAGGILIESPKGGFALGETLAIRILPGLINQPISCDVLVIGKVPKIPPGYALKFKELKQQDKEAIDFFVQEALKKEQQRAI